MKVVEAEEGGSCYELREGEIVILQEAIEPARESLRCPRLRPEMTDPQRRLREIVDLQN
jgi:hypothetical protein